jgi:hypothetical protein
MNTGKYHSMPSFPFMMMVVLSLMKFWVPVIEPPPDTTRATRFTHTHVGAEIDPIQQEHHPQSNCDQMNDTSGSLKTPQV